MCRGWIQIVEQILRRLKHDTSYRVAMGCVSARAAICMRSQVISAIFTARTSACSPS